MRFIPVTSRARWLVGALTILVVLVGVATLRPKAKAVATTAVKRADLIQSVVATGKVNLPTRADVGSEVTATILRVAVREGDRVRQGDVLVQLADSEARATLTQAQAALEEARARQHQQQTVAAPVAQATLTQAQANLRAAEAEHRRTSALVDQGFYSRQRLDDSQRALDTARSSAEAALVQQQAQQPQGVETELSRTRLRQAQAAEEAASARLQRLQLRAPFDGVVLTRQAEPGALAQPGKVLLGLGANHQMRIDMGVDERHLALLKAGMSARVVADAYPGQPFAARLDWVSPAVDATRGTVDVRLAVDQPPAFLRPDMTVSAELTVGQQRQVLVVDAGAVRDADGTNPWVLVVRDNVAQRAAVTLGLRGVGQVEVKSGLAESDLVIPATEKAAPGDRVRASTPTAAPMSLGMGR